MIKLAQVVIKKKLATKKSETYKIETTRLYGMYAEVPLALAPMLLVSEIHTEVFLNIYDIVENDY